MPTESESIGKKCQQKLLYQNLLENKVLSSVDIVNDIVVVDGCGIGNPPIFPPDGIIWRCLSVSGVKELHVQDELDPSHGLMFTRIDGTLPFICMPQQMSLDIIRQITIKDILWLSKNVRS